MSRHATTDILSRPRERARARSRGHTLAVSLGFVAVVAVVLVVAGVSIAYIRQGTMIRDLTAQYASAQARLTEIEEVNQRLVFEIEQAFSLSRVSELARDWLGMEEPEILRYVPLSDSELP